jgi:hypothetical protein
MPVVLMLFLVFMDPCFGICGEDLAVPAAASVTTQEQELRSEIGQDKKELTGARRKLKADKKTRTLEKRVVKRTLKGGNAGGTAVEGMGLLDEDAAIAQDQQDIQSDRIQLAQAKKSLSAEKRSAKKSKKKGKKSSKKKKKSPIAG